MEKVLLKYTAKGQMLIAPTPPHVFPSNTVNYIEAEFSLDETWASEFDSVRAIWQSDYAKIPTVIDSNGRCMVPQEVLSRVSPVKVNLVGEKTENDELTRLTTFPVLALEIVTKANIDGLTQ